MTLIGEKGKNKPAFTLFHPLIPANTSCWSNQGKQDGKFTEQDGEDRRVGLEEQMKNRSYSKAKVLTLIPIIVLAVTVICMVLATILEVPTSRGAIYSVFAFAGLMSIFLSPLPCLVISIIGTIFAAIATKERAPNALIFLILGIIEILVYVGGAILAIIMFIAGQGV